MKCQERVDYVTRHDILNLLLDDEVARVSAAEASIRLDTGDEYLDLERLDEGVRRAIGTTAPMGRVLPRKSVREATWKELLARLAQPRVTHEEIALAAYHRYLERGQSPGNALDDWLAAECRLRAGDS